VSCQPSTQSCVLQRRALHAEHAQMRSVRWISTVCAMLPEQISARPAQVHVVSVNAESTRFLKPASGGRSWAHQWARNSVTVSGIPLALLPFVLQPSIPSCYLRC
jgi:hypothetical protein